MLIYKIFRAVEWEDFRAAGVTSGAPVDLADGYIHFSTADQAPETAARHFGGEEGLMIAAADPAALGPELRWEPARGGQLFPHLYRPLRLDELVWAAPLPLEDGAHAFPEEVVGHVDPTRGQFDAFKALPRETALDMLNLVRLRERARYPEGHPLADQSITGAEAYRRYAHAAAPVFARVGGSIAWRGRFEAVLIGPARERWDHVFVARYPSAHAFLAMITDPDYRSAVVHRQAAVRTSRLIRCAPEDAGDAFA